MLQCVSPSEAPCWNGGENWLVCIRETNAGLEEVKKRLELLALDGVEWSKLIRRREVGVRRELQHDLGIHLKERKGTKFKRGTWRQKTNWDQFGHWGRGGGR